MPFSIASSEAGQILKLEGTVTIRHAQDLATLLGQSLEDGLPLAVDTAGLEDIDTSILQLLFSLYKSARQSRSTTRRMPSWAPWIGAL